MLDNDYIVEEFIPGCLKSIEEKYDVKILLAVESGSRAWGFASKDSDWDVRFIYVHKPEWYFSIDEKRDVIETLFDNAIDAVGWDLKKALMLLKRSNPSLMEWINSPIVYRAEEHFINGLKQLAQECFNPTKAMYHYQRIYVKHDERYLQKQGYPMKRFMYYLRGILACQWIEKYQTLPPVAFQQLYEDIVEDQKIKVGIKELVNYKSSGKEMDMSEVPDYLVNYYLPLADHYSDIVGKFRPEVDNSGISESMNRFFYEMVTKGTIIGNALGGKVTPPASGFEGGFVKVSHGGIPVVVQPIPPMGRNGRDGLQQDFFGAEEKLVVNCLGKEKQCSRQYDGHWRDLYMRQAEGHCYSAKHCFGWQKYGKYFRKARKRK